MFELEFHGIFIIFVGSKEGCQLLVTIQQYRNVLDDFLVEVDLLHF